MMDLVRRSFSCWIGFESAKFVQRVEAVISLYSLSLNRHQKLIGDQTAVQS